MTQAQKEKILKGLKAILHGSSNKDMKSKFSGEGEGSGENAEEDEDEIIASKGTVEEREEAMEAAKKDQQVMEVLLDLGGWHKIISWCFFC